MTRLYLILTLIFCRSYVLAQPAKEQFSHRVGVGVPYIPLFTESFRNYTPSINISYKAGKNKNYIRSGVSHWINHSSFTSTFNAGYERRFFNGNFQILAGADIGLRYYQEWPGVATIHYKYSELNFGTGPVVGISYKPFNKISFESEWGMFIGIGREKYETYIYSRSSWGNYATAHRWFSIHAYYHLK